MTHMLQRVPADFPTTFALGIPEGRFAWAASEDEALTFVWIRDYTSGKRAGERRVRTQHGADFREAVVIGPGERMKLWNPSIGEVLIGIYCDPARAARAYGTELGRCSRLGCELTDRRSRHYGIGPECEKHWPWFVEAIDNELGATYEELLATGQIKS